MLHNKFSQNIVIKIRDITYFFGLHKSKVENLTFTQLFYIYIKKNVPRNLKWLLDMKEHCSEMNQKFFVPKLGLSKSLKNT